MIHTRSLICTLILMNHMDRPRLTEIKMAQAGQVLKILGTSQRPDMLMVETWSGRGLVPSSVLRPLADNVNVLNQIASYSNSTAMNSNMSSLQRGPSVSPPNGIGYNIKPQSNSNSPPSKKKPLQWAYYEDEHAYNYDKVSMGLNPYEGVQISTVNSTASMPINKAVVSSNLVSTMSLPKSTSPVKAPASSMIPNNVQLVVEKKAVALYKFSALQHDEVDFEVAACACVCAHMLMCMSQ
jgi:hypothetical protein